MNHSQFDGLQSLKEIYHHNSQTPECFLQLLILLFLNPGLFSQFWKNQQSDFQPNLESDLLEFEFY